MRIFQLDELETHIPWLGWYKIRALMAHPTDDKARQAYLTHYISSQMVRWRACEQESPALTALLEQYGGHRALVEASEKEVWRRVIVASDQGLIAGHMLDYVLLLDAAGEKGGVLKAEYMLKCLYKENADRIGVKISASHKTILEAWRQYKSVAHLWAAFCSQHDTLVPEGLEEWTPTDLSDFLASAEAYRRDGIQHISSHQKGKAPLLKPEETWECRMAHPLPTLAISFPPLTDQEKRLAKNYKNTTKKLA